MVFLGHQATRSTVNTAGVDGEDPIIVSVPVPDCLVVVRTNVLSPVADAV
jgi:hypothetical protein